MRTIDELIDEYSELHEFDSNKKQIMKALILDAITILLNK